MGRPGPRIGRKGAMKAPSQDDGFGILAGRLWPRALSKKGAAIDLWLKDVAPSTELRRWFGHDPDKWEEFRERYWAELDEKEEAITRLKDQLREGPVTFVFAATDEEHNSAV